LLVALSWTALTQEDSGPACDLEGRCTRVVDGDTITLRGGETVRLLGIDTPEIGEPYARDAKLFTLGLVAHEDLRLEFDEQLRDTYGRLLAYVYVEKDDGWVMVNAEIVRAGLARLLFYAPNERHRDALEEAWYEAVLARRGMWDAVSGVLTVEDLEGDLVTCTTEVVTVAFEVAAVEETEELRILYAAGSDYGFRVEIPYEIDLDPAIESAEDLVGRCVQITGFLDCDVEDGPFITLEIPEQLVLECPADDEA
jgi:micrococcal nuclease